MPSKFSPVFGSRATEELKPAGSVGGQRIEHKQAATRLRGGISSDAASEPLVHALPSCQWLCGLHPARSAKTASPTSVASGYQ